GTHKMFPVRNYDKVRYASPVTETLPWMLNILPYLDQQPLFDQWVMGGVRDAGGNQVGWWEGPNKDLIGTVIPQYLSASTPFEPKWTHAAVGIEVARTDFYAPYSSGLGSLASEFPPNAHRFVGGMVHADGDNTEAGEELSFRAVRDGTTNTLGIVEMAGLPEPHHAPLSGAGPFFKLAVFGNPPQPSNFLQVDGFWAGRNAMDFNPQGFSQMGLGNCGINCANFGRAYGSLYSFHPGGAHALVADGSVQFLSESMDNLNLLRLLIRNDGQTVEGF
ncbi:MAG: DUF1559 domain-containing protein, partial [Planctomycetota bacterium]